MADITHDSKGQAIRTPKLDENGDVILAPEDASDEYKEKNCMLISGHPTMKITNSS